MFPLSWLLIAWIICLAFYALIALFTLSTHLRYGVSGLGTYLSAAVFTVGILSVCAMVAGYANHVDWNQMADFGSFADAIFGISA